MVGDKTAVIVWTLTFEKLVLIVVSFFCQDSTHYEKTLKLLEKYDPDYVPPTPRKVLQMSRTAPGMLNNPQEVSVMPIVLRLQAMQCCRHCSVASLQCDKHVLMFPGCRNREGWWGRIGGAVSAPCSM